MHSTEKQKFQQQSRRNKPYNSVARVFNIIPPIEGNKETMKKFPIGSISNLRQNFWHTKYVSDSETTQ